MAQYTKNRLEGPGKIALYFIESPNSKCNCERDAHEASSEIMTQRVNSRACLRGSLDHATGRGIITSVCTALDRPEELNGRAHGLVAAVEAATRYGCLPLGALKLTL